MTVPATPALAHLAAAALRARRAMVNAEMTAAKARRVFDHWAAAAAQVAGGPEALEWPAFEADAKWAGLVMGSWLVQERSLGSKMDCLKAEFELRFATATGAMAEMPSEDWSATARTEALGVLYAAGPQPDPGRPIPPAAGMGE